MEHNFLSSLPNLSKTACRLLVQRNTLDIFNALGECEMTAKEIADALGKDLSKVWHALRQLVQAGLLTDTELKKRKGRSQKLYRTCSKKFFIPATKRVSTVGRELGDYLLDSLESDDAIQGEAFSFDGTRWRVEKIYQTKSNAHEELWLITSLTVKERQTLTAEIKSLFEKYRKDTLRTNTHSLVHFAYAPHRIL